MGIGANELIQAAQEIGRFAAMAEAFRDNQHTCINAHHRYPFPLERVCPGCVRAMDKHIKRNHLEGARILGWDALFDNYVLAIELRIAKVETYRHKGAYI